MAFKGKPFIQGSDLRDYIEEKRREQSRKPERFYSLVEKINPGTKYEMFTRQQRAGWGSFGIESMKFERLKENPFFGY
jgi:N6-adenosine-specific RNA methylase IME4